MGISKKQEDTMDIHNVNIAKLLTSKSYVREIQERFEDPYYPLVASALRQMMDLAKKSRIESFEIEDTPTRLKINIYKKMDQRDQGRLF
jgi:hypothetical protein